MSTSEHRAIVDKGLKMKIKRKNADNNEQCKKGHNKSEQNKADTKLQSEDNANGILADKACKLSILSDKEMSPKSKSSINKKDKGKGLTKSDNLDSVGNTSSNGTDVLHGQISGNMEPKLGETPAGKKDCVPDPYEFNAKVEDGISTGMPICKKVKLDKEKIEMTSSSASQCYVRDTRDASTDTEDVAVVTEPDCLGPCEPGTQVTLEGIVWHESDNGVLVVNVTWRGKTYVGTLLDATRHDWAPPRINCDSPTVELESRMPKGRGKRRGAANTPVNDTRMLRKGRKGSSAQTFMAPPSPAKCDISTGGLKRKGKPQDIDPSCNEALFSKRSRSGSQAPTPNSETPTADIQGYIECPEPNCNKKYRHANGLKYHQSHAHSNSYHFFDDAKEDMDTEDVSLSVIKNSLKKEKEVIKKDTDNNKKELVKDNSPSDKNKCDTGEISMAIKIEHEESPEEKTPENNKNDQKSDNINLAKRNDNSAYSEKNSFGQSNTGNATKTTFAQSISTKPISVGTLLPNSSQGNSNFVQPFASQMLSKSSVTSSVSSLTSSTTSTFLSLASSSVLAPSLSSSVWTPSSASLVLTPSLSSSVWTPSSASSVLTPSLSSSVWTPSSALSILTPSLASSVLIPSSVSSVLTPSLASSVLIPSSVSSVLTPSLASSVLIPSSLISSMVAVTQGDSSKSEVKLVDIKPKVGTDTLRVTKPNRLIVPAHNVVANVQVTHSNLSPVVSHTQMSPQLKPIQPKPTIMGEPQNVNQSLVHLSKDRKKMYKTRPKDAAQVGGSPIRPEKPTIKIERTGVIKANPMPASCNKQNDKDKYKYRCRLNDSQQSHTLAPHSHKGVDLTHSHGSIQNPNLLKVGSPLHVNTPDSAKGPVSDDAQSPAYSDISDANESASPAAPSDISPQKLKEEPVSRKEEKQEATPPQVSDRQNVPPYGMYPYYTQSQYIMNNMSPGQKSSSSSNGVMPSLGGNSNLDNKSSAAAEKKNVSDEQKSERKPDEKEISRKKGTTNFPLAGLPSGHMTSQQLQEYQMQLYHQQQMYIQSLPRQVQYQYMTNGWYPTMDPAYMQQMIEEQCRLQSEQGKGCSKPEGAQNGQGQEKPGDSKLGQDGKIHGSVCRKDELANISIKQPLQSSVQNIAADPISDGNRSNDDRNTEEQALRDNQSENQMILKENIDLKNELEKNRQEHERRQEEIRRCMYQEQKKIEEKKKMDLVKKGESRLENLITKAPGTRPIVENSLRNLIPGQCSNNENVSAKRDMNSSDCKAKETLSKDVNANKYSDLGKSIDEKSKTPVLEKHRSETTNRNPELSKQRLGGSSTKSGSPTSSVISSNVPGSPSYNIPYNHTVPAYAYMPSPHFMGIDPSINGLHRSHSVNAAMLSVYPVPGYIHPSQMDYRPTSVDVGKDSKPSVRKSIPPTGDGCDNKNGELVGSHGSYYGPNVHKIHELTEKGRPKSRDSPGHIKSTDTSNLYEKHRDYTSSPPTQRHVHTHHHMHVLQSGPGLQAGPPLQAPGFSPVYDPYSGGHLVRCDQTDITQEWKYI